MKAHTKTYWTTWLTQSTTTFWPVWSSTKQSFIRMTCILYYIGFLILCANIMWIIKDTCLLCIWPTLFNPRTTIGPWGIRWMNKLKAKTKGFGFILLWIIRVESWVGAQLSRLNFTTRYHSTTKRMVLTKNSTR